MFICPGLEEHVVSLTYRLRWVRPLQRESVAGDYAGRTWRGSVREGGAKLSSQSSAALREFSVRFQKAYSLPHRFFFH